MTVPTYYLNPVAFGDVRAGVESISAGEDTRISMGIPWLTGLVISQGRSGLNGHIKDLVLDNQNLGSWAIDIALNTHVRTPLPAHKKRLRLDGQELLDVLDNIPEDYGYSVEQKIWRISMALLVRASLERKENSWSFQTPLERRITVTLQKMAS